MALLDGSETVVFYPTKPGTDSDGNERQLPWSEGDPVVTLTGCYVAPLQSTDLVISGQAVNNTFSVLSRSCPVDPASLRLASATWSGRTFDVYETPLQRRGVHTRHVSITLTERTGVQ